MKNVIHKIDDDTLGIEVAGNMCLFDKEDFPRVSAMTSYHVKRYGDLMYASASIGGLKILMHRLIMSFPDSPLVIDHINGNGLDNRKLNLRVCTQFENLQNRKPRGGSKAVREANGRFYIDYSAHFSSKEIALEAFGLFKNITANLNERVTNEPNITTGYKNQIYPNGISGDGKSYDDHARDTFKGIE